MRLHRLVVSFVLLAGIANYAFAANESAASSSTSPSQVSDAGGTSVAAKQPQKKRRIAQHRQVVKVETATTESKKEEEKPAEEPLDPSVQPLQYWKDECLLGGVEDCFWKDVKVAGYLGQSYEYNFNRPKSGISTYRFFDQNHDEYNFNLLQLSATKDSTEASPLGFGIKTNFGRDVKIYTPYNEATSDHFDLTEAWVSYLIDPKTTVKAGRLPTLIGFEVLEEKDNFNITRGLMYTLLEPVTHTGIRVSHKFGEDDAYELTYGISRGWDTFRYDNNDKPSFEGKLAWKCDDKLNFSLAGVYGPELIDNNDSDRGLLNFITNYQVNEKTATGITLDYLWEENSSPSGSTGHNVGLGYYLKHDFTEKCSLAARIEAVTDRQKRATGVAQNLGEVTLTGLYKFRKNLWGRLEYRHDHSTDSTFEDNNGFRNNQNTIAASLLYTF